VVFKLLKEAVFAVAYVKLPTESSQELTFVVVLQGRVYPEVSKLPVAGSMEYTVGQLETQTVRLNWLGKGVMKYRYGKFITSESIPHWRR
jgi:hypothetical protein